MIKQSPPVNGIFLNCRKSIAGIIKWNRYRTAGGLIPPVSWSQVQIILIPAKVAMERAVFPVLSAMDMESTSVMTVKAMVK